MPEATTINMPYISWNFLLALHFKETKLELETQAMIVFGCPQALRIEIF